MRKILYARVSSADQNIARQLVDADKYYLIEETCSGTVPFLQRPKTKEILLRIKNKVVDEIAVTSIDRLSRDLADLLKTIKYFNELKIPIHFISQGIRTIDSNGNENAMGTLVIQILGMVAQMERSVLLERQRQGIEIAKGNGVYKGRKSDTKEDIVKFLSKPKNKVAFDLMKQGNLTMKQIAKLSEVHINTLTKIKKLGLPHEA